MGRISIKGVLVGGIVDIVSSFVFGLPFALYAVIRVYLAHTPQSQIASAITEAIHGNLLVYTAQLLVGLACSTLGGYMAAWLAKHDELLNGGLSAFLCVALGTCTIASGKGSDPRWLEILLLIAGPAAAVLGGDLMRRRRQQRNVSPSIA